MGASVVVRRGPRLARPAFDAHRCVRHRARQRVPVRVRERGEVHRGLGKRSYRADRVQRAIEAEIVGIPAPDYRQDLPGTGRGHRKRALERGSARAPRRFELRNLPRHGLLGRRLHARVQGSEDPQPLGAKALDIVVASHLPADEVDEGRVGGTRHSTGSTDSEPTLAGRLPLGRRDHALLHHDSQHRVPPGPRPLGVAVRVVEGGALHQPDEESELLAAQLLERPAVVVPGGKPESVDGPAAALTEKDLVQIRLEDLRLLVARLEKHGEQRFVRLAPQTALGRQKEVLRQLLRQRAAALHCAAGPEIGEGCPCDPSQRDPVVGKEFPVLDRQQALHEERRHLLERDENAVLAVGGINLGNFRGIEPRERNLPTPFRERDEPAALEVQFQSALGLMAVPEAKLARDQSETGILATIAAGPAGLRAPVVARQCELALELVRREPRPGVEIQWSSVDPSGQRPSLALELGPHVEIEPGDPAQGENGDHHGRPHGKRAQPRRGSPAPAAPAGTPRGRSASATCASGIADARSCHRLSGARHLVGA